MATPQFTISYAKVEYALAQLHSIAPKDLPRFRSRFGALQRAGMLGARARPGKGTAVEYGPDEIHRAMLTVELNQLGISPAVALGFIDRFWTRLRAIFAAAEKEVVHPTPGGDIVLFLAGTSLVSEGERAVPNLNHVPLRKLPDRLALALTHDSLAARAVVLNLTGQLRRFHRALAEIHLQPEPPVEKARKKAKGS
jgi:hypothetical protein